MNIIAISQLRSSLPRLVDEVATYMKRFIISVSGEPKAVILNLEELESLEETAEILSSLSAYKKIRKGLKQAKEGKIKLLKDIKI